METKTLAAATVIRGKYGIIDLQAIQVWNQANYRARRSYYYSPFCDNEANMAYRFQTNDS